MIRSNCVLVAVRLWWRRWRRGEEPYLVIRLSRIRGGLIHVLVGRHDPATDQVALVSLKPLVPHKDGFAPLFDGRMVRGDRKEE